MNSNFYVYTLINPLNNEPFYVGKGSGSRAKRHEYNVLFNGTHSNFLMESLIKFILENNKRVIIKYAAKDLTHSEAILKEIELISKYGRINNKTGILCNLTDGGEGSVGRIFKHSTETKLQIGKTLKNRIISEDTRKLMSEVKLGKYKGRILTEEWKLKLRLSQMGKTHSEKSKQLMSVAHTGENNPAAKRYLLITPTGEEIIIKSLKTFCKDNDLNYDQLRHGKNQNGWLVKERLP